MIKMKNDVVFDDLIDFGFRKIDDLGVINYIYTKKNYDLIISWYGAISLISDYASSNEIPDEILGKLYDLIKANFVEKVD